MTDHDPWAGTSGLRDDFDGTITSFKFVYDSEYNNGQTLIARVEIDPEDGGEPEVLKLSTGSGWEDDAKGTKAKREDGADPKGFSKSCNVQRFFTAASETDFLPEMKKSVPWDGTIWPGNRFHFVRKEFPAFNDDPNAKKPEVTCPTEYLGGADGAKKKAPAKSADTEDAAEKPDPKAKAAAAKAAAAKAKAAAASGDDELEGELGVLAKLAGECDSHDEFIEKAYAALDNADDFEEQIVNEDFYNEHHS